MRKLEKAANKERKEAWRSAIFINVVDGQAILLIRD